MPAFKVSACVPAALFTLSLTGGSAFAQNLVAHYSVKLIGLSLGTASVAASLEPVGYRVEATAKLTGIGAMVSNSKGAATATGQLSQGRIAPGSYATTSANSKMTRTVRIAMNSGDVVKSEIVPPFEEGAGRVPFGPNHTRGIVDPLSALVMPMRGADSPVGPAACNRTIPVYDGWTRFDVSLHFLGVRNVQARGYSGPVSVCAARYTPLAGHRPDRPATSFMTENKEMEVWLAPVGDSRVVMPFRISVATQIGTTVIEATEFSVGGAATARR